MLFQVRAFSPFFFKLGFFVSLLAIEVKAQRFREITNHLRLYCLGERIILTSPQSASPLSTSPRATAHSSKQFPTTVSRTPAFIKPQQSIHQLHYGEPTSRSHTSLDLTKFKSVHNAVDKQTESLSNASTSNTINSASHSFDNVSTFCSQEVLQFSNNVVYATSLLFERRYLCNSCCKYNSIAKLLSLLSFDSIYLSLSLSLSHTHTHHIYTHTPLYIDSFRLLNVFNQKCCITFCV
jgi:hypothetical protein